MHEGEGDGDGDGMPLSEAETEGAAREMAEQLVDGLMLLSGIIVYRQTGRVGLVRERTRDRSVDAWMCKTREWAREWRMGPWTAICLCTFAVCKEQYSGVNGAVAVEPEPGVQPHPSAQAQAQ
jgi:hypothetical protein